MATNIDTRIDQIKIDTDTYDIDLPPDATPSIVSLTVASSIMFGTTGKVTLKRPTGTTDYTITLPSSGGILALHSEIPGKSTAPGAVLVTDTTNTYKWRNALTFVSNYSAYLPFSPAFGIYSNGTSSDATSYITDSAVSCRKVTVNDGKVPTIFPDPTSDNSFTAYYSATMLNPVTCLINIASAESRASQVADGYLIIPLSDIFKTAGISQSNDWRVMWRVMNYNVTPRRQSNSGYSVGYWASLWKPVSGIVGANYGSYPYDSGNNGLGLLIAVDENVLDNGFEAGIIVSRPLN